MRILWSWKQNNMENNDIGTWCSTPPIIFFSRRKCTACSRPASISGRCWSRVWPLVSSVVPWGTLAPGFHLFSFSPFFCLSVAGHVFGGRPWYHGVPGRPVSMFSFFFFLVCGLGFRFTFWFRLGLSCVWLLGSYVRCQAALVLDFFSYFFFLFTFLFLFFVSPSVFASFLAFWFYFYSFFNDIYALCFYQDVCLPNFQGRQRRLVFSRAPQATRGPAHYAPPASLLLLLLLLLLFLLLFLLLLLLLLLFLLIRPQ